MNTAQVAIIVTWGSLGTLKAVVVEVRWKLLNCEAFTMKRTINDSISFFVLATVLLRPCCSVVGDEPVRDAPVTVYLLAGLVWMQGESDAYFEKMVLQYETNLTNFITRVRHDFNTPQFPWSSAEYSQAAEPRRTYLRKVCHPSPLFPCP